MNIKQIQFFTVRFLLIILTILLSGCFRTEQYNRLEHESQESICRKCTPWTAQYEGLENRQITINKPIDLCAKRDVLYVKMHNHSSLSSAYFEDAAMITLEENDLFHKVVTREPTLYINVEPYSPEIREDGTFWYDTDDPLTIGQIRKLYPQHGLLILETRLQEFDEDEPIALTLNLIDPSDGSTIVFWRSGRDVWYRTEDMQTVSMLKQFNHWLDDVEDHCEMVAKQKKKEAKEERREREERREEQHEEKQQHESHHKGERKTSVLTPIIVKEGE